MADDEFRLGKTILLGVGDHPAIIPMLSPVPTKSIMVKAGRELTLERVKVFYGNDRSKTLYFDKDLKEDQESGWKSSAAGSASSGSRCTAIRKGARPGSRYTTQISKGRGKSPPSFYFFGRNGLMTVSSHSR